MKKLLASFILALVSSLIFTTVNAQCSWQTEISDSYEYSTTVPGLVPGKTVHTTPQSYAVHTGALSLYMNFVTCNGGTGACAGDKIYERKIPACPYQRYRFSTWITTSFSGTQSNVRIAITDKLGNVLDNQLSLPAPYFPAWYQYQSPTVIPLTDTIIFTLYTNVPGVQSGNDLSMDDFLMEKCLAPYTSDTTFSTCGNSPSTNLFDNVPFQNSINGTWFGPTALAGGYLGTFNPSQDIPGIYIYTSVPFGVSCPTSYDTIDVSLFVSPTPELGPDTTICSTQSIILNSGVTGSGYTYLWSNGVTGPNVNAFAPGGIPTTTNYTITVTDSLGCAASDSITVNFIVCSGIDENIGGNTIKIFPQPANENISFELEKPNSHSIKITIYNSIGEKTEELNFGAGETKIVLSTINLSSGVYFYSIQDDESHLKQGKLIVSKK